MIRSKYKLEFFNVNWSYSYDLKIDFAKYQIMRANRKSWAGTSIIHNAYLGSIILQLPIQRNVKGQNGIIVQKIYTRNTSDVATNVLKGVNVLHM